MNDVTGDHITTADQVKKILNKVVTQDENMVLFVRLYSNLQTVLIRLRNFVNKNQGKVVRHFS